MQMHWGAVVVIVCLLESGCRPQLDVSEELRAGGAGAPVCVPFHEEASVCWEQMAPMGSGGFPPEAGSSDTPSWRAGKFPLTLQPILAFNDDLWMLSRTHAWSSSDGLRWTHRRKSDWGERIGHEQVFFLRRLWMLGGLRYADRVPLNDVWSSADGASWREGGNAAWSPRKGHAAIAFQGKLWLFGGADRVRDDFATEGALNDVWSSEDGLGWVPVTVAAPWAPREGARILAYRGELYLIGGAGRADVWRSLDGVDWAQCTPKAMWKPRHDYGTAVFADRMWVFGGWQGNPTNGLNDVWHSSDGETWTLLTQHAPWSPRSPRSIVYRDRLWIFSGKHTGARDSWGGDVWTMRLSGEPR
jgi:hypothetical protein